MRQPPFEVTSRCGGIGTVKPRLNPLTFQPIILEPPTWEWDGKPICGVCGSDGWDEAAQACGCDCHAARRFVDGAP